LVSFKDVFPEIWSQYLHYKNKVKVVAKVVNLACIESLVPIKGIILTFDHIHAADKLSNRKLNPHTR